MKRFDIINTLIKKYNYKSYLEIGTANRKWNFDKIEVEDKICVDPDPIANADYVMESDKFFFKNNRRFDIIFIDGLHEAIQVRSDIENSLKILNPGGAIVIHDCSPKSEKASKHWRELGLSSSRDINFIWNGDVFKGFLSYKYHSEKSSNNTCFTVNADHGCGVIINKKIDLELNEVVYEIPTINEIRDLSYTDFNKNRKQYLTLITQSQFNNLFQV